MSSTILSARIKKPERHAFSIHTAPVLFSEYLFPYLTGRFPVSPAFRLFGFSVIPAALFIVVIRADAVRTDDKSHRTIHVLSNA